MLKCVHSESGRLSHTCSWFSGFNSQTKDVMPFQIPLNLNYVFDINILRLSNIMYMCILMHFLKKILVIIQIPLIFVVHKVKLAFILFVNNLFFKTYFRTVLLYLILMDFTRIKVSHSKIVLLLFFRLLMKNTLKYIGGLCD